MKFKLLPLSILGALMLMGCSISSSNSSSSSEEDTSSVSYEYNSSIEVTTEDEISVSEATEDFVFTTTDGAFTKTNNVYQITKAGTYLASGRLEEGQILVEAGDDDEVIIELNGVTITNSSDSPIKALTADKVEISAKSDTGNTIIDNRSKKTTDNNNVGEGAIYAKTDLKLKGSGTLVVTGNYNNGIHTSKDLTIQKETLKVTGYNNAIKGNNSVTISSGVVHAYSVSGDGIKTEDSDVSSSGNQKGTVTINGGTVYVNALHDAVDASYDVVVDQVDETIPTVITLKTGTKSSTYSSSTFKTDSEKGLKAANSITINNGDITIAASDDAIHANYGTTLGNSLKGTGNILVNGGTIKIASGDDGIHSDNTLTINGGTIYVTNASEGFEANYYVINGGKSYIYGTDDGVNCSKKSFSNCSFTMNDGYLDVAVSSGDTDGIDSNGNFFLNGGVIITRGSSGTGSNMSTGLDVDGTCSITGGTLIAFNGLETKPTTSSNILYAGTNGANSNNGGGMNPPGGGTPRFASNITSASISGGEYTLTGTNIDISFVNDYSYSSFLIYSSLLQTGSTYTLSRSGSTIYSWSQSSSSVTIS